jgi:hypothetical protein
MKYSIVHKATRSFVGLLSLMLKPSSIKILFFGLMSLSYSHSAFAQIPSWGVDDFQAPAHPRWQSTTVQDVEAAYRLLRDNHPGAAPEMHDAVFQQRLDSAYKLALERARTVTSYQGYKAVLAGFATNMGDKHIWSRPTFVVNIPRWPGFIVSKRGGVWIVSDTDPPQSALLGASLVACDGENVEDIARKNLGGFRADWSIGAQQIQSAPWLLVDEGNPFIVRPKACEFEHNGQRQTVTLDWTRVKHENLEPRLKKAIGAGAAGYGVRRVGEGYWIALEDLMDTRADAVVKVVENEKNALRNARFVVLDLRGNPGGSDLVGREIAVSLLGSDAVDARLGPVSEASCGSPDGAWRASEGNINNLKYLQHTAIAGGSELQQLLESLIRDSLAARAQGKAFAGPITCPSAPGKPTTTKLPPGLMKGRLILLTDNVCFSACLSVTEDFRKLGAFHVGQTTDAATHYTAVREQYLPSGYSLFSTLQAVDPSSPYQAGPFEPQLTYDGDIADTAALETWVVETVVPASQR